MKGESINNLSLDKLPLNATNPIGYASVDDDAPINFGNANEEGTHGLTLTSMSTNAKERR